MAMATEYVMIARKSYLTRATTDAVSAPLKRNTANAENGAFPVHDVPLPFIMRISQEEALYGSRNIVISAVLTHLQN